MLIFPCWWSENGECACPKGAACPSPAKHPLTSNGVKDASADPAQIAAWRTQWPQANWGVAAGSGLVVVDLDRKPGKDGLQAFAELAKQHGGIPRTATVRTGSGGIHLYFATPNNFPNSASKIGPGIDVRSSGGYVIGPGSTHANGKPYAWELQVPPAPLPAWLEALLGQIPDSKPATERGWFPPASDAVLEDARDALLKHGPAVEGNAGDVHTFKACAILRRDFALTADEGWPLLAEWNQRCVPAWDAPALRSKLDGGDHYGSAEYGCKRSADALAVIKKLVDDFSSSGRPTEAFVWEELPRIQKLYALLPSLAAGQIASDAIRAATGLKLSSLALPKIRQQHEYAPIKPGSIEVSVRLHEIADKATEALAPLVFQRSGVLCEVVKTERTFIHDLDSPRIQDLMGQCAEFFRNDQAKGETVNQSAPERVAVILSARRGHKGVRVLEAVTSSPVFLSDGTILQTRGYNESARVFLEPDVTVDVPDHPTKEDARKAALMFRDLLCDFKFAGGAIDFAAWLAALMSPLVKAATANAPAPLFCVSASNAGAGKTLLTDVIAHIVTGGPAEIRPYNPRDPGEWGKRLTAFVKAASPVSVFDNCNGALGDESLDRLVTSRTWSDRILGGSDAVPLPNVTTWMATGNNIEPVGDTVRRVMVCRIEVDTEKPQERTGFKRADLVTYALEHRSEFLSAALTMLRAYHLAGRPDQNLAAWGSFTAWSQLVRGALVWTGLPDPVLTQHRAAAELNEPENDAHDFWIGVISESDGSAHSIVEVCTKRQAQEILGTRDPISAVHLKRFVGRFVDKPRQGKRIRREGGRYRVEAV